MFRKFLGLEVLVALVLGAFAGVFLGPLATVFKPIGDAFVMLLQMVVLPYVCFSIMHGLGSVTPKIAKEIFKQGWHFWALLWLIAFLMIYLFCQFIPTPLFGSFAQESLASDRSLLSENILTYLIPENPFYDLVNNIVPAIAVFGVIAGFALMHIGKKEPLLGLLERANQLIEKILRWIAIVSPIGVFAHIATITGTAYVQELYKIEFYIGAFIAISLFLVFVILPLLLTCLTPMTYRESLRSFESVCLLSFVTGLPTIAIPFLNIHLQSLEKKYRLAEKGFHTVSQTVMPLGYAFTQIGNALLLFFVFFISFYFRNPFTAAEKLSLAILTIPLSIGSSGFSVNSIAFLVKQLGFPAQAVELFTQTMAITVNFQVLLSIASVLTFSLLVLFSYYGLLKVRIGALLTKGLGSMGALVALIFLIKPYVHLGDNYQNLYMNLSIKEVIQSPVETKVYLTGDELPAVSSVDSTLSGLDRAMESGVLRIGYYPQIMPYSYFNTKGELSGYDIAMAYQLAADLDCKLEFIPLNPQKIADELNAFLYDIGMSAISMDEKRIQQVGFSHSYSEQKNVLIVPFKNKKQFKSYSDVAKQKDLRIGVTGSYKKVFEKNFPNATLVEGSLLDLIEGRADAWIWSEIPAHVWCLEFPKYTVIEYGDELGQSYLAYPVKIGSFEFLSFLNNWLNLKTLSGFTTTQYDYWIEGVPLAPKQERWSIIRNVLHWVE